MYDSSQLFCKAGYLSLKEYREDIDAVIKRGPWKIPFGISDRVQLYFLKIIAQFSWFADTLHIVHTDTVGPAYKILFSYLRKNQVADNITERTLHYSGYFFYSLEKKIVVAGHARSINGHGIAEERAAALSKAFGEMLERTISGIADRNTDLLIDSPDKLGEKSPLLYPPKYHRFLALQKERYEELENSQYDPITWVRGLNLVTRKKTYIPKQITSWFIKNHTEAPLVNATTNGSAGYFTKEGALLRGLLETIERDAFLVHWLTQIPPQIVRQETLSTEMIEKIYRFESLGISLSLVDVTTLAIPSIVVVAINTVAETPQVVVSGASATTFERAIRDALREMVVSSEMFYYRGDKKQMEKDDQSEPFVSTIGQIGRQLYWRGPDKIQKFQWFLSGKRVSYDELCTRDLTQATDDTTQLNVCLEVLKKRGSDYYPIAYFPKHPIQKKLGFYVAQVYVPKAFPLYLLECQGTFDSDRLEEFALSKGISKWELNPLPHMFP